MHAAPDVIGSVAGIVPAAGRSARMGTAKPLLEVSGESFLARAVRVLRAGGCRPVVVVVAAAATDVRAAAAATGARVVENPTADSEQVDSVRLALAALPTAAAVAILPVDVPYVSANTVTSVIQAWQRSQAPLVIPEHAGVAGHPVLVSRALFAAVMDGDLPEGIRSLLATHAAAVERIPVPDPGTLVDLDTPADLERHGPGR